MSSVCNRKEGVVSYQIDTAHITFWLKFFWSSRWKRDVQLSVAFAQERWNFTHSWQTFNKEKSPKIPPSSQGQTYFEAQGEKVMSFPAGRRGLTRTSWWHKQRLLSMWTLLWWEPSELTEDHWRSNDIICNQAALSWISRLLPLAP